MMEPPYTPNHPTIDSNRALMGKCNRVTASFVPLALHLPQYPAEGLSQIDLQLGAILATDIIGTT